MAISTLVKLEGGVAYADTAATADTIPVRDSAGGLPVNQLTATEVKTTGTLVLARSAKTATFTADASAVHFPCDATGGAIVANLPPAAGCPYARATIQSNGTGWERLA
jgi:hypothetical protein